MRYKSGLIIDHAEHAKQGPNMYMKRMGGKKRMCAFKMGEKDLHSFLSLVLK